MIAEVIVDIASGETDKVFDYLCDDCLVAGARVRAPFGGRTLPGFVIGIKETSEKAVRTVSCADGAVLAPFPACRDADGEGARVNQTLCRVKRTF